VKRLLLGQGLPRSAAALLTQAARDAVHLSDIGMSQADDRDIFQRGRAERRIGVTLDADFHSLLAINGEPACSVIRIRSLQPPAPPPKFAGNVRCAVLNQTQYRLRDPTTCALP
jgi:predicted nuclease of predicted toxin-antitoxin system